MDICLRDSIKNEKILIQVTIRECTDLNKLYERLEVLGNMGKYVVKFKDQFLKYCQALIDQAKQIDAEDDKFINDR